MKKFFVGVMASIFLAFSSFQAQAIQTPNYFVNTSEITELDVMVTIVILSVSVELCDYDDETKKDVGDLLTRFIDYWVSNYNYEPKIDALLSSVYELSMEYVNFTPEKKKEFCETVQKTVYPK